MGSLVANISGGKGLYEANSLGAARLNLVRRQLIRVSALDGDVVAGK